MFIKNRKSGHTSDGQQKASGKFLIVCDNPYPKTSEKELRACVRFVAMKQLGHWMMGSVRLAGHSITLSGTYGSDGLPLILNQSHKKLPEGVPEHIWDRMTPLPAGLQEAFWEGGGHNCAGSEGPAMRDWALKNLKELSKSIPVMKQEEGCVD